MEIVIRKATPDDIPVLVDFQLMLARETENIVLDRAVVETGIKAIFTDHAKGFYQVAVMDNELPAVI